jgi:hypothetical protein
MSETSGDRVSEFGVVGLDDVDAFFESDDDDLDALARAASLARVRASIGGGDGGGLGGGRSLFGVGFFAEFVGDVSLAVDHLAEHSRDFLVLRTTQRRGIAEFDEARATFLGGQLTLSNGLLALEGEDHIGLCDGDADDTNIDADDGITFLAGVFEILAGLGFFAVVTRRQIVGLAIRRLSGRRRRVRSSRGGTRSARRSCLR